jgi:sialidase-1
LEAVTMAVTLGPDSIPSEPEGKAMPAKPLGWAVVRLLLAGMFVVHCFPLDPRTVAAAAGSDGADAEQADFFERDVFVSGREGYHTFRIPALTLTPEGTLLAFCEGRKTSREDLGNNDLVLKRSKDGGRTWGELQLVHEEGERTIGNPTVVLDQETGTVWLFMLRDASDVLLTKSTDGGQTWPEPIDITGQVKKPAWGFYAVGPGVGIQLRHGPHQGRLVIPAYHRATGDKSGPSTSHVFYSDDHGRSWTLGGAAGPHTNECQLVETLDDGESVLLLNMRNHWARSGGRPDRGGQRLVARSRDGGASWSEPDLEGALIEPTCQASVRRFGWPTTGRSGRILFSNPAATSRKNMTVRLSEDEGRTWPAARTVYAGSSAYSCLAALPEGRAGLLYERDDYGKITFASFTLDWLKQSGDGQNP